MKRTVLFAVAGLLVAACGSEQELPKLPGRSQFRPSFLGGGTQGRQQLQRAYPCPEKASDERRNRGTNIERLVEFNCFGTKSSGEGRDRSRPTYNVRDMVAPKIEQTP